ncbi:flagella basal body P-ring formation protein FlgA [Paraburkholderia bannensis]|uniref:Flagella basal body P-ring formation protein FlgA n=1 Tax=Paraburkholderia bannensis TaxID=765414 RepID=A0A7W9TT19_9BURK|nr:MULTISPECIES: flagellar basal body P-ring formation chaperone FlgA [Paraburkholderia]MBB3255837.1 flagella basal body P-ring formation protein FlgA [Paraburkholderia sp. WP4_3_2]MBB6100837.1 flagella basal body P-ring formation protein FlgA [Paraburkholderia bannensis]
MPQTAHLRAHRAAATRLAPGRSVRQPAWRAAWAALAALIAASSLLASGAASAQSDASAQQIYIAGPGDRAGEDAQRMSAMLNEPSKSKAAANAAAYAEIAKSLSYGANARAAQAPAAQSGMISIPGAGERGTAVAQNAGASDAPQIVTIASPGTPAAPVTSSLQRPAIVRAVQPMRVPPAAMNANMNPNATAGGFQRVSVAAPSRAVTPVVVPGAAAYGQSVQVAQAVQAVQPVPPGQEDGERIRAAALAYLQQQSAGLPGKVEVSVAPVFPRGLAACDALEPFMPPGARSFGRTTVGVRCVGAKPWTLYVQGRVVVQITYYVASRQINPGEALSAVDFVPRDGDLSTLPQTVITDPSQANGAIALMRITSGLPLRSDMLRSASSVVIGQTVKVIAVGANFTISSEGSVLNNAAPGQLVRVRTPNGQIISGVVKDAATVQVQI